MDEHRVGAIIRPQNRPETYLVAAREADRVGLQELWIWEDCFLEGGLTSAAAMLAATNQVSIGIGLLPVPLRNVAVTAMELATIQGMFPGRLRVAVGHGVQEWMGQVGARASSPMTLMSEYLEALRMLLSGEVVSYSGTYVQLDEVALNWPPDVSLPILMGAIGPNSLALAGRAADGVLLDADLDVEAAKQAIRTCTESRIAAGVLGVFDVALYQRYYRGDDAQRQLLNDAKPGGVSAGLIGSDCDLMAQSAAMHQAGVGTVVYMPSATDPDPIEYLGFIAENA